MPFPHFLQRLFGRSTSAPEPEPVIPDDLLAADMARYDALMDLGYFDDENELTTEQREALSEALDEKFEELRDLPEFKNATAAQLYIAASKEVSNNQRLRSEDDAWQESVARHLDTQNTADTNRRLYAPDPPYDILHDPPSNNSSILRSTQVTPENTDAYWVMEFSKSHARGR